MGYALAPKTQLATSLLTSRIIRWIVVAACAADVMSPRFICWLFPSLFVSHDALLRRAPVLRLRHAGLSAMLAAHILLTF